MTDARPLALITGASSGIGLALAHQFARRGVELVVCAEDGGLDAAATALRLHGVPVHAVRADLADAGGVSRLADALAELRPLDAAVLNAGVGQGGGFLDTDVDAQLALVDLNVRSTVHLAHVVLAGMRARRSGRVLVTSSIGATMPGSYQAVYNASKSFLQSFVEAVADELRGTGVTVTSLMPGPTETNFFHRAGMDDTPMGRMSKDDVDTVAAQGYEAMMNGSTKVVAGSLMVKAQGVVNAVLPDQLKAAAHRLLAMPPQPRGAAGAGTTGRS